MQMVSMMPVENKNAIPEPLVRAKMLLDQIPGNDVQYEMALGVSRLSQTQSLQEMRKAAAQRSIEF